MKEKDFLKHYRQEDYERPSVAVDMTVFSVRNILAENYRKLPEKVFSVLLIKRAEYPFKDMWALPGGFIRKGENAQTAARRELEEETGIKQADLKALGVFSDPQRDPRGWIISCGFMALIEENKTPFVSKNDAAEALWFRVSLKDIKKSSELIKNGYIKKSRKQLILTNGDIKLSAVIETEEKSTLYDREVSYKIIENNALAFDHAKIIAFSIDKIRRSLEFSADAFRFVADSFTLTELQQVYETILDKKLLAPNFRRKIKPFVEETSDKTAPRGHRSARIYRRNIKTFLE